MTGPSSRLVGILVAAAVLVYLAIGTAYAVVTPDWQVPDEPAHYNYVRQLAAGTLPVIELGDYDQAYLEMLTAEQFPESASVSGIEYEDHQPPLYYLLAVPFYWLFKGALIPLRLVSLVLGAGVIYLTYRLGRQLFPSRPVVTLTAVGLVAFVPQHIAMMAGVNNDSLAELVLAGSLLAATAIVQGGDDRHPWHRGLLLGVAFVTKAQAYVAGPVLLAAILVRWRQQRESGRWLGRQLAGLLVPALVLGGAWWVRNLIVYGGLDWMGLEQHNQVVVGQPTTADWIALYGLGATLERFAVFTFRSFWGMFGWMGVVMDARIYQALALFSLVTAGGLGLSLARPEGSRGRLSPGSLLLAFSAVLTLGGYLWYNLTFVQHQGRYLFPALLPLGLAAGIAWEALAQPRPGRLAAGALVVAGTALAGWGLMRGDLPCWSIAFCTVTTALLWLNGRLPERLRWLLPGAVGPGLAALSLASLLLYIQPALA